MEDVFARALNYQEPQLVKQANAYPFFQVLDASEGPVATYKGKEVVMLGSNNYLGLTHHPRVMAAAHKALDQFGTGCTGSRFLNGNLALHQQLEAELAAFFERDAALVFSAGFLANAGTLAALGDHPDMVIFSERENHASLIDGARLVRGEKRVFRDELNLAEQLAERPEGWPHALVVTDAVFSMTGRVADLTKYTELRRKYGFRLYVDDAHGIGVYGKQGRGTVYAQNVQDDVDLLFGTFSKSLASQGGFVVGDEPLINWLQHVARTQIFTAALPPASVAASLEALRVMQAEPSLFEQLWDNAAYWGKGLRDLGFYTMDSETPIQPIFIGSESLAFRICTTMLEEGVFATPVIYPAVPWGQALIRTSVMPAHTREHLDRALDKFADIRKRYPIPEVDPDNLPIADGLDYTYFFESVG